MAASKQVIADLGVAVDEKPAVIRLKAAVNETSCDCRSTGGWIYAVGQSIQAKDLAPVASMPHLISRNWPINGSPCNGVVTLFD